MSEIGENKLRNLRNIYNDTCADLTIIAKLTAASDDVVTEDMSDKRVEAQVTLLLSQINAAITILEETADKLYNAVQEAKRKQR